MASFSRIIFEKLVMYVTHQKQKERELKCIIYNDKIMYGQVLKSIILIKKELIVRVIELEHEEGCDIRPR